MVTVSGAGWDDAALLGVEISFGDNVSWAPVNDGGPTGWVTWSHTFNISHYEEGNLTIHIRAFDGEKYSEERSLEVVVQGTVIIDEEKADKGSTAGSDDSWLWLLILVVIVVVTLLLIFIIIHRNRKQREREEEEERLRMEEEGRDAASRAAVLSKTPFTFLARNC